jgi:hypothetical protein
MNVRCKAHGWVAGMGHEPSLTEPRFEAATGCFRVLVNGSYLAAKFLGSIFKLRSLDGNSVSHSVVHTIGVVL